MQVKVRDTMDSHCRFLLYLLAERVRLGELTQREVAEATGVHQSQVSRILAGGARRTSKNVLHLCKFAESLPSAAGRVTVDRQLVAGVAKHLGCSAREEAAIADLMMALRHWREIWGRDERPA